MLTTMSARRAGRCQQEFLVEITRLCTIILIIIAMTNTAMLSIYPSPANSTLVCRAIRAAGATGGLLHRAINRFATSSTSISRIPSTPPVLAIAEPGILFGVLASNGVRDGACISIFICGELKHRVIITTFHPIFASIQSLARSKPPVFRSATLLVKYGEKL